MSVRTAGPEKKATHREIVQFLRQQRKPFITAKDVKNRFGVTRAAANDWLSEMVEQEEINRKDVGASAVVYWLPNDED